MKRLNAQIIISVLGLLCIAVYIYFSITSDERVDIKKTNTNNYKLFHELYENLGYTIRKANSTNLPSYSSVIIFLNYNDEEKKFLSKMLNWVQKGGTLLLAGIDSAKDPISQQPVKNGKLGQLTFDSSISADINSLVLPNADFITDTNGNRLISSLSKTVAYKKRLGLGTVYVFTDSIFFHKKYLGNEDVAVLMNNILQKYFTSRIYYYYDNILIDKVASPIMILFKGNMLYVMIQLFIIIILFVYWKAVRFGKPIMLTPYARRSLHEHLLGTGLFYRKTKTKNFIDETQSRFFVFKMKKILGLPEKIQHNRLVDITHRLTNISKKQITELITAMEIKNESQLMDRDKQRTRILDILYINKNKK